MALDYDFYSFLKYAPKIKRLFPTANIKNYNKKRQIIKVSLKNQIKQFGDGEKINKRLKNNNISFSIDLRYL